tara:strand:+ start:96 stop:233 length:138 start_codon:yes stop_codon:yes gene_type:complete
MIDIISLVAILSVLWWNVTKMHQGFAQVTRALESIDQKPSEKSEE